MTTLTRNSYTIGLDARADLRAAGDAATDDAIEDFIERYQDTADLIAAEKGVSIHLVTDINYGCPAESYDTDEEAMELWQELHNRTA